MTTLTTHIRRAWLLALVIPALVAVLALIAVDLGAGHHATRRQFSDVARLAAAQMAVWSDGGRSGVPTDLIERFRAGDDRLVERFEQFGVALMRTSDLATIAVTDAQGEVVCAWPRNATPTDPVDLPADRHAIVVRRADAAAAPGLTEALAPVSRGPNLLPLAYVVVTAELPRAPGWMGMSAAAGIALVLVVVILMGAVTLRLLDRRVCRPLAELGGQATNSPRPRQTSLPLERTDEVGAIARRIDALRQEVASSRQKAQRLQRSMDETITRQTRQMSRLLQQAKREADLDALTGLCNRRYLDENLERIYSEQAKRGVNLAIAMFDVDQFKPLNDRAGHPAGDALLRFLGELLRSSLRDGDVGIRYGGDEFVVIFVDIAGAAALEAADRVVRLFAQRMSVAQLPAQVTLSAGVAALDDVSAASGADLLAQADQALYRAKHAGKNQVASARAAPLPARS